MRVPISMTTENMSRNGLLLRWESSALAPLPRVGDLLTIEVELPAHHGFEQKCIHCQATVVRVSGGHAGGPPRVGLSVNYMDFRSLGARIADLPGVAAMEWTL
jgi:hypothetical protein